MARRAALVKHECWGGTGVSAGVSPPGEPFPAQAGTPAGSPVPLTICFCLAVRPTHAAPISAGFDRHIDAIQGLGMNDDPADILNGLADALLHDFRCVMRCADRGGRLEKAMQ